MTTRSASTARRSVHVVNWGAVSGFGDGSAALLDGIWSGCTAIRRRARTAAWPAPTGFAAEVPRLAELAESEQALTLARDAAEEALGGPAAAGLDRRRIGLVLASTKADLSGVLDEEPGGAAGLGSPAGLAARLAADLGLHGGTDALSCACASGLLALSLAARRIAAGALDTALVVGVDVLTPFVLAGFGSLGALDPEPCRPFDARRRGASLGEGAAAMLLSGDAARGSGAVIVGHGGANDACHVTGPDRHGSGVALATRRALRMAGSAAERIDVVHAHGTGTPANDSCETRGLRQVFGDHGPPVFGTKGQTGHTLGAAGLLECGVLIAALRRGSVPANFGLEQPDEEPRLDLVRSERRLPATDGPRRALKVSTGFGGVVAAVVVES